MRVIIPNSLDHAKNNCIDLILKKEKCQELTNWSFNPDSDYSGIFTVS